MSFLTEKLPEHITISDRDYAIKTDFRVWLEFDRLMSNTQIPVTDKFVKMFILCFDNTKTRQLPPTAEDTFHGLCSFYIGKNATENAKKIEKTNTKSVSSFDYEADAELIYAAFLTQYKIDLVDIPYLHWYKFLAMFRGLSKDNKLSEIMGYRQINLSEIKDSKQKNFYRKMKDLYALPDNRSEEQKEQDFVSELTKMF